MSSEVSSAPETKNRSLLAKGNTHKLLKQAINTGMYTDLAAGLSYERAILLFALIGKTILKG